MSGRRHREECTCPTPSAAGQLGEPMVLRLLEAGVPVTAYARRPEVRERLAHIGTCPFRI
ncbi:hypothetical protein BST14_21365 [Mycobacterium arosiense ATCC BAA-1401 = DSM 45069]|uniref:6-phosphogluconate dehydrogenase NADP-binding domain-containing protein n=1 Tax=Mycobacterium arosiense ATCC BAA-1401 = DSM 45069 TaxID=1265311 RepID=A0A1W9Z9K7_MYCAI|nr:hypothetical protein BST14_21365 [Mycobacterium arosiense ATCC BAA-1401 = DSM 45069]